MVPLAALDLAARGPGIPGRRRSLVHGDHAGPGEAVRRRLPARPQRQPVHLDDPQPSRAVLVLLAGLDHRPVPLVGTPRTGGSGPPGEEPPRPFLPGLAGPADAVLLAGRLQAAGLHPAVAGPAGGAAGPRRRRPREPTRARRTSVRPDRPRAGRSSGDGSGTAPANRGALLEAGVAAFRLGPAHRVARVAPRRARSRRSARSAARGGGGFAAAARPCGSARPRATRVGARPLPRRAWAGGAGLGRLAHCLDGRLLL